ncbi:hypothetical protein KUV26_23475 [Leisingera daeponensis]|uniref:Uncharacterized protein n=1 Tax=Leisingera daeponensis TaxID=405746 RepID=A0ABS7NQF7_9RHOB|nr:hypothetical protein [Leisingera daeponensis]MBY6142386.1 hypothetical protein [Leisingera daeponensis]
MNKAKPKKLHANRSGFLRWVLHSNGTLPLEELQAACPKLTSEIFAATVTNADGEANLDEVHAAQSAGLPAPACR